MSRLCRVAFGGERGGGRGGVLADYLCGRFRKYCAFGRLLRMPCHCFVSIALQQILSW